MRAGAGRTIEHREGSRVRDVRFLHTGEHVNTADPIEFVAAALGPRAADVGRCWPLPPTPPPTHPPSPSS